MAQRYDALAVDAGPHAAHAPDHPGAGHRPVTLVLARSRQEWDAALAASGADITPFHRWEWLEGQAALQGWRFTGLLVRRGDSSVGAIPLLLRRRGPFWLSAASPFVYAGPVLSSADLPEALPVLHRWCRRRGVLVARLDFSPSASVTAAAALTSGVYDVEEHTTYVLDLPTEPGGLRAGLDRSVRKSLNVAARAGVRTSPSTEDQVTRLLPTLMREQFGARGLEPPYPPETGRWIWRLERSRPPVMLTAHVDGREAGLLIGLGDGGTLYEWAGGALREFRDLRVNHALHVALYEAAADAGYRRVDMLGSVDAGVSRFKATFGARRVPFLLAQQTSYRSYSSLRKHWGARRAAGGFAGESGEEVLGGSPPRR